MNGEWEWEWEIEKWEIVVSVHTACIKNPLILITPHDGQRRKEV